VSACLVDAGDPCGDELVETATGACMCPEGTVPDGARCAACGENEHPAGGECACDEGFVRATANASCEPFSAECQPPDCPEPCEGDDCEPASCESSAECASPLLCDVHGSGACEPPPEGLGKSCASDADCAGTEATYCEVFQTLTCQVENCVESSGVCPGDMQCCDFQILGRSLCIPSDSLNDGECPAPGKRVDRE
jgi:hypothetical protein